MKKIIFIIITLFSFSSLNADYLKFNSNYCVIDYWYGNEDILYYIKSSTPDVVDSRSYKDTVFIDGYVYDSNTSICSLSPIPQKLGIQYHEYKFLMGLMGLLVGFAWLVSFLNIFSRR